MASTAVPRLPRIGFGLRVAGGVVALVIGVAVMAVPAAAGSDGGPVVYTTYRSSAMLATINPDGTGTRVLVPGSGPAWSPDGRWIAYTRDYEEIWRVRPNGTGARRVARWPGRSVSQPAWSPHGNRIAYAVTWATGEDEFDMVVHAAVYVANRNGSGRRLLCRDASGPAWSPDGRRIAVQTEQGIATVKPNGHAFALLHRVRETLAGAPRFSPNGRWLLFLTYTSETETTAATRTNLLDMLTGRLRRIPLSAMPGWPADATWTPRGTVAFLVHQWSRHDGLVPLVATQLKTIQRNGTNAQTFANLTEWAFPGAGLSWRASG